MMWNLKYGPMNFWQGEATIKRLSADEAKVVLRRYLETYGDRSVCDPDLDEFYGYYTVDLIKDGKVAGMASVNAYNGAVWFHDWHGSFIAKE
jgi:hypothetical protein